MPSATSGPGQEPHRGIAPDRLRRLGRLSGSGRRRAWFSPVWATRGSLFGHKHGFDKDGLFGQLKRQKRKKGKNNRKVYNVTGRKSRVQRGSEIRSKDDQVGFLSLSQTCVSTLSEDRCVSVGHRQEAIASKLEAFLSFSQFSRC